MKYLLSVAFVFCFVAGLAQQTYKLSVVFSKADKEFSHSLNFKALHADSLDVYKEAEQVLSQLQFKGYLLAEIVSLKFTGNEVKLALNAGPQFKWVKLSEGNLPPLLKQNIGFKEKKYTQTAFNVNELQVLFKSIINYYENTGYPFANVSLDSIAINDDAVSAKIKVNAYNKIVFDVIEVVGNAEVGQRYLQSYLNIKQDAPYNEFAITQIENRLQELPFITVVKPAEVSFSTDKAKVRVFAQKKNSNQFDGVVGFQQEPLSGKLQLVGDLKLNLQNALKMGEQLKLNYQGLPKGSQVLAVNANVPQLLSTNVGLLANLNMFKQDSLFLNVDTKAGFSYLLSGNNALQFFVENKSTSLSSVEAYKDVTVLPPNLDASTLFYGLGINLERLDYRFNPQKGFDLVVNVAVGNKKIKRNSVIASHLYDDLNLNSTSYRLFGKINYYKSLKKHLVLALSNETAFLSNKSLLANELFRLGGQKSLRGFNELSILATNYTYFNAELRYLLAQHSFLFAFYNQAYVNYKTETENKTTYPLGFGAGINVETSLGILSIGYALGKEKNNPLNLRQGKIHLGITALF